MQNPIGFIYSKDYLQYNFGEGHPLNPLRIGLTYSLMEKYHLLESQKIKLLTPQKATDSEVLRIHDKNYIEKLKELNDIKDNFLSSFPRFGLGPGDNPIFLHIYDASMMVVGASLTAAKYLLEEENNTRAVNLLGGLHHAMPDMASGFCILNDIAVTIQHILDKDSQARIMYLDLDLHHGDGVQYIFYDKKNVLTMSFHQSGDTIFPGTGFLDERGKGQGFGYSLNVPLNPGTFDSLYLDIFTRLVPQVMDAYQPDYLVTQCGVDTHFADTLGQLSLSTTGIEKTYSKISEWVPKYVQKNKWLILGGGGYNLSTVARSWTLLLCTLLDEKVENHIPEAWLLEHAQKCPDEFSFDVLRDFNAKAEEIQLKNPYFVDQIDAYHYDIIQKYEQEFIPFIKNANKK